MHPVSRLLWGCSAQPAILPHRLNCVNMVAFPFYLQSGKQRKVGWVGNNSHVVFGKKKKSPGENGSGDSVLSWCNNQFLCRQNLGQILHTFSCSRCKDITVVCRMECLACNNELFVNNPNDVKENYEHALYFAFSCLTSFDLSGFGLSIYSSHFFPEHLSNHCQGLCHTLSEICIEFDVLPLSDLSQNRISPDTWLQIKGHKNQHLCPAAWNFVHWLPT
jgi:hypothetical protein